MNIFGPTIIKKAKEDGSRDHLLPVLVYIHGGAYKLGSGNEFKIEDLGNLSKEGFVVVTIQYRLSVLGFFYPPSKEFPSKKFVPNLGLDDTHLALRFISTKIEDFGGDPQKITVIGHSAGGCSAHALALSGVKRNGLFRRVILMSGVLAICFHGAGSPQSPSAIAAKEICHIDLYNHYDDDQLFDCLKNASLADLEQIDFKHERNWELFQDNYYFPKIGQHGISHARGVDFLFGVTTGEWAFFENLFAIYLGRTDYTRSRFRSTFIKYMGIDKSAELDLLEQFYSKKANSYPTIMPDVDLSQVNETSIISQYAWFENIINGMTDLVFHLPIAREVLRLKDYIKQTNAITPKIFVYTFDVKLSPPSWNRRHHAAHSDDLPWLFGDWKRITNEFPNFRRVILHFAKEGHFGDAISTGVLDDSRSNDTIIFDSIFTTRDPKGIDGFCVRAKELNRELISQAYG